MAVDRNKIFQNAEKLVRQGKVDQAITLFEQLAADNPRDMTLKNRVGDLLAQASATPEAIKVFTEIAEFYAEEGFYLKAIAIYKKISRHDPSSVDGYFKLAELYAKQGLNNDAKSQYQQVADIYIKQGETAKAAGALQKLVLLDPENIKVRVRLAEVYTKLGNKAKASGEYGRVGDELSKKGMHEEALKLYEKGLAEADPDDAFVAGYCKALLGLNRHEELIEKAKTFYAKHRDNVGMLTVLVEAYRHTGRLDLAVQVVEKLIVLDPENTGWGTKLSEIKSAPSAPASTPAASAGPADLPDFSEMTGDYSMEELEHVSGQWNSADSPSSSESGGGAGEAAAPGLETERAEFIVEHTTEAEVFIKYGLVEKAIENLEAIVNHYPEEAETLRRLKDLYLETGNKARAAERCVDLAGIARAKGEMQRAMDLLAEARAHDPKVKVDRTAMAAVVSPESVAGDDSYSFGGSDGPSAVDRDSGSSGVELNFDSPPSAAVAIDLSLDEHHGDDGDSPLVEPGDPNEGDLAEIDFYAEGGFVEEAKSRLLAMRERYPKSDKVRERLQQLGVPVTTPVAAGGEEGIEFFDDAIRAPLRDAGPAGAEDSDSSLFEQENQFLVGAAADAGGAGDADAAPVGEDSLEEIFQEFKKGVEAQLDTEDYETHYNLGIAYREMGLVDEAIAEFQLAAKDATRLVDCCSSLGLCFREKGMPKLAVKWYNKALETLEMGTPQHIAVLYELGEAYEEAGDNQKALETFTDVFGLDSGHRDVAEKVRKLEGE